MIVPIAKYTARLTTLLVGVLVVLFALFTLSARVALPVVANQKADIESRISDYLGSPVDIGDLSLSWKGLGPLLIAQDVAVYPADGRAVTLEKLLIDVDLVKSMWRQLPVVNELSLIGADLAIESTEDGSLKISGMEAIGNRARTAGRTGSVNRGVDLFAWLFNARKVALLDSTLNLVDRRADRTVVVDELNIRVENDQSVHQLRVEMRLPEELGGKLEAGIDMTGTAQALDASTGRVYLSSDRLQAGPLMSLLLDSGFIDRDSRPAVTFDTALSLELWGEWRDGLLVAVNGPVSTGPVLDLRNGQHVLDSVSGRLSYTLESGNHRAALQDVRAIRGEDGFSISQLVVAQSLNSRGTWSLSGHGADLSLSTFWPLPALMLAQVDAAAEPVFSNLMPTGRLKNWSFNVRQYGDQPLIDASIEAEDVGFSRVDNAQAFGLIDVQLEMVRSKGELLLDGEQMQIDWALFGEPTRMLDSMEALVELDLTDLARPLARTDLKLNDEGIRFNSRITTRLSPGESPHVDMQSEYSVEDIATLKQWLPRGRLPPGTVSWVDRAIQSGKAENGSLLFFGHLADFPFSQGQGVFRSSVDITQGELAFLPAWPAATDISGRLELDGLSVNGLADQSHLASFSIGETVLQIDDITLPVLRMQGQGRGGLQNLIDFANNGPLQRWLRPALSGMQGSGSTRMDIDLLVPLFPEPKPGSRPASDTRPRDHFKARARSRAWTPMQLDGSLRFDGNRITLGPAGIALANSRGNIDFDLRGIRTDRLRAVLLGKPVVISAASSGTGLQAQTQLSLRGALEASDVLAHYGNALDQFVSGSSDWTVNVAVPHDVNRQFNEGISLQASSDLVGTTLKLPAPYYKDPQRQAPLQLNAVFRGVDKQQRWQVVYDQDLFTQAVTKQGALDSLIVQVGDSPVTESLQESPPSGIRLQGQLDTMSFDGWVRTVSRYLASLPASGDSAATIPPISSSLQVNDLIVGKQMLGKARFRANSDEEFLNLAIDSPVLSGNLRYPRMLRDRDTALRARVSHLDWTLIDALSSPVPVNRHVADGELDPRLLPAIEARISNVRRDNLTLTDLVVRAEPNVSGLDITTLGFAYDTMRLVGKGYWYLKDPQGVNTGLDNLHQTHLDLVLQSDDFGVGLSKVGLRDIILDGRGSIEASLSWDGPAYNPDVPSLSGSLDMSVERGSIIPFEPGAGRVVGLFALQALPRRLNLDFKDLTEDGLAFRRIIGEAEINQGIANVNLLQLTGPIGVVELTGRSDLQERRFDQQVSVLPRVSAALPLIGAISGGASAGIGAIVATGFLKVLGIDFDRLGLRRYSLTGSWDKPELRLLDGR